MDPNFTPGSDEYEQQLFEEQQDFRYSVLISSLKTEFSEALDRIPSTNPGAEPPRDARDSGSARSHSTHLDTSSSDRP